MSAPLLRVRGLAKQYGGLRATDSLDLDAHAGEIHALIGPNGAGKTTLVAQLAGTVSPDAGTIEFRGRDVTRAPVHERVQFGLGRSFQITSLFDTLTALDNVILAVQAKAGSSLRFWRAAAAETGLVRQAEQVLDEVGLTDRGRVRVRDLGHGERRQLEVALALAGDPALVLLDEPMAGLGPPESRKMVDIVRRVRTRAAILLVEHDMDAVFVLSDRISVLVAGRVVASGTPDEVRRDARAREAYLGHSPRA